jgi:hypothetical protein
MSQTQIESRRDTFIARFNDIDDKVRIRKKSYKQESRSCGIRGEIPKADPAWALTVNVCEYCGRHALDHPRIETLPGILTPPLTGSLCPYALIGERRFINYQSLEIKY